MPHYCRICGRRRPNEKFSGKGHASHVCKDCQRMPSDKRKHIETIDEIAGYLEQSNISPKNINRLEVLAQSSNEEVQKFAALVLEIAKAHPRKRRRVKFLARNHRDLYDRMKEQGFFEDEFEREEESDFESEQDGI